MTKKILSKITQAFTIIFIISNLVPFQLKAQWQQFPGPDGSTASVVYQFNGSIFMSSNINQIYNGVYRSDNNGNSWVDISVGLSSPHAIAFTSIGSNLFAALDTSVFMTSNMGATWTDVSNNLPATGFISRIAALNGNLYVSVFTGSGTDEIFYSTNNGSSWTTTGFYSPVSDFYVDANKLWSCGSNGSIYVTTDGINWTLKAGNIPFSAYVNCIGGHGDTMYCSWTNNTYMTTDGGNLWMPITTGLPSQTTAYDVQLSGNTVLLGTYANGLYTSTIGGTNWSQLGTNFPNYETVWAVATNGNNVFAATYDGLWGNTLTGSAWTLKVNGLNTAIIRTVYADGNFLLAGIGSYLGLYYSNNNGASWSPTNLGYNSYTGWIKKIDAIYWSGSGLGGLWSSSGGIVWSQVAGFFSGTSDLVTYGNNLMVAASNGVYLSNNSGATWTLSINGMPANPQVLKLFVDGVHVYAFINGKGVYKSDDGGINWSAYNDGLSGLTNFYDCFYADGYLIISGFSGKYRRTSTDANWLAIPTFNPLTGYYYLTSGKTIFAGAEDGVYISDDLSETWHLWNDGFTPYVSGIRSLNKDGNLIYAGTTGFGIWKRNYFPEIETSAVAAGPYCPGYTITVNFNTFTTFQPGNKFIVQLSDSSGHWINNPVELDSVTSTIAQPIVVTIPSGIKESEHYLVRVIATKPYVVSDDNGNYITINKPPVINLQPANQNTCEGSNTGFYVGATGTNLSYQWQLNTGSGWSNLSNSATYQNVNDVLMLITNATASMSGYQYRCVVSNACGPPTISAGATLFVSSPAPTIIQQPVNDTICEFEITSFTCLATGPGIIYKWQYADDSGFFIDVPSSAPYTGNNTSTLTINGPTANLTGTQFRCKIGNSCVFSDPVILIINGTPATNASPTTINACNGGTATFTVYVPGGGITYQWEENAGSGFLPVVNGGIYTGADSSTLSVTNINVNFQGYIYRCIISGVCSPFSTISSEQTLNVITSLPTIILQPANVSKCESNAAFFATGASGTVGYQWQINMGAGWYPLANIFPYNGVNSDTLQIDSTAVFMNGHQFRCVISGCSYTNAATLTVLALPVVSLSQFPGYFCYNDPQVVLTGGLPSGGNYFGNGIYNNQFWPVAAGLGNTNLTYIYTSTGGCTSSATQLLTVSDCIGVGMNETEKINDEWVLFPNPANDFIFLKNKSNETATATIQVLNIMGQTVFQNKIIISSNQVESIDVSNFSSGLYFVLINNRGGLYSKKAFVKMK